MNEFCENDFESASLNRIIKNAGISKGTFYYHFENKEALYLFLLEKGVSAKWNYISDYTKTNKADFSKMDIFDKFLYQAKAAALFADKYPRYHKLSNMLTKEKGNPIYEKALSHLKTNTSDILEGMVAEAYENNELDTQFSKKFLSQLLAHLFSYFDDIFADTEGDLQHTLDTLESYVEFIKYGIKNKEGN